MKNTIINRYLAILILICFGFGQDEYPNFSDPIKQFQFEEQKISINKYGHQNFIIDRDCK